MSEALAQPDEIGLTAEQAIPGLIPDDYAQIKMLARLASIDPYDTLVQPALDQAFTNPNTASRQRHTTEPGSLRRALTAAKNVAESGLAWRVTANPKIPESALPATRVLEALRRDSQFQTRYNGWQQDPSSKQQYLYMQSRLIGFTARYLAQTQESNAQ